MKALRLVAAVILLCTLPVLAENTYTADQAKSHVGEKATVCGMVASAHFAASSKGQPTFLNLDKPYPNQIFTILIWGSDRAKFGNPERDYARKNICITGTIQEFRGSAEIIARSPDQITVK
jgi:hypothetical protein